MKYKLITLIVAIGITNVSIGQISSKYLGIYHGIQAKYFMKNQFGDDMIIRGNKVSVPSSDYKFLLKLSGIVSLQQTNIDTRERYYYNGTYKEKKGDTKFLLIECKLSDGVSKPTYIISINRADSSIICIGHNEPEFELEKTK